MGSLLATTPQNSPPGQRGTLGITTRVWPRLVTHAQESGGAERYGGPNRLDWLQGDRADATRSLSCVNPRQILNLLLCGI